MSAEEPCKCGRRFLKQWWEAITDAGDEGTDRTRHSRESCLTETERRTTKRAIPVAPVQHDLEAEVSRLRASLERVRELLGPKHREAFVMQGPRALIPVYNEVCATLDATKQ